LRISARELLETLEMLAAAEPEETEEAPEESPEEEPTEDTVESSKDTRLPEELHLKENADIPKALYSKIEEAYEIAADVRELAATSYNFTANASGATSEIMKRKTHEAVLIQAILSTITTKFKSSRKAQISSQLRKLTKDLLLIRDSIADALKSIDTSEKRGEPDKFDTEEGQEEEVGEDAKIKDKDGDGKPEQPQPSGEELEVEVEETEEVPSEDTPSEKEASILITAVENASGNTPPGRGRARRMVREMRRPRIKKIYRYRVCSRPEWHRSVRGKFRWRTKCVRTDGKGSPSVKLVYLGFDRAKRPSRVSIKGKNIPVVNEGRYRQVLEELRTSSDKKKGKLKPPKAKVPPGTEVTPDGKPKPKGLKKEKLPKKDLKPEVPVKEGPPPGAVEAPKKPAKKKKPKKKAPRTIKKPAAEARKNPEVEPPVEAVLDSAAVGKIARRSWMKDAGTKIADMISRHPAILQGAAFGIGLAASIGMGLATGKVWNFATPAQVAAGALGAAASLRSPDPKRIVSHIGNAPPDQPDIRDAASIPPSYSFPDNKKA